jgi:hypothetical protein
MSPTGHLAIGFMSKQAAPKIHLVILLIASYLIDLLFMVFRVIGIDKADFAPWSHSLLMAIVWSIVTIMITYLITRQNKSSLILGLIVFSHWILDFIVWNNLPVAFDRTKEIGIGVYNMIGFDYTAAKFNSPTIIAMGLELGLLIIGLAIYFINRKKLKNITA